MAVEERITPIEELKPGLKNVYCIFIVIEKGSQQKTKDGSTVRKCRVADRTGSIIFSVWNSDAEAIDIGDIIKLAKGYSSLWKGNLVLYCGKYGSVERLGEFTMVFSETPDMSVLGAANNNNNNEQEEVNGSKPHPPIRRSHDSHVNNKSSNRHHPYSQRTREQGW